MSAIPLNEYLNCNIVAFVNKGKIKETQADYEAAIMYYKKAIKLYPKDDNEYFGQKYLYELIGGAFEKLENFNKAIRYFLKSYQCHEGVNDQNLLLKISVLYKQLNNEELSKYYADLCIKQGSRKLVKESPSVNSLFKDDIQTQNEIVAPKIYKVIGGEEYTFEEWKVYENKQWKIYQGKKNKKLFGLF